MTKLVHIKDSIATRLLAVVFSIYLILTITVTLVHMGAEYSNTKDSVIKELRLIKKNYEPALATALWNVNKNQLKSAYMGMMGFPSIIGLKIENEKGRVLGTIGTVINDKGEKKITDDHGKGLPEQGLTQLFWDSSPITFIFKGKEKNLGTITLYSSSAIVLHRVKLGFLFIIFNSIIKTVGLWIIFLMVSRKLLSRPLAQLAEGERQINLDNLKNAKISIHTKGRNELKILEESFNFMIRNLNEAYEKIQEYTQELQVKNETLLMLDKLKDEFISNISHEIRTPLNGILGFSELLTMDAIEDEEEKKEYYQCIYHDSQRLIRVLNNVIQISMLESQCKTVVFDFLKLSKLAKSIKINWKRTLGDGLKIQIPKEIEIETDEKLLNILLNELIHNSTVFNDQEPEILIKGEIEKDQLTLKVIDNGVGISDEHFAKIFEKFYRIDSGIQYKRTGGIGLGLAVVKGVITLLNGRIEVNSRLGEGTTFLIQLPLKQ